MTNPQHIVLFHHFRQVLEATCLAGLPHRVQAALLWPLVFDSLPLLTHHVLTHTMHAGPCGTCANLSPEKVEE